MTRDEIAAAYRFAGVPDPDRMAAAFAASEELAWSDAAAAQSRPVMAIPSCPECRAASAVWIGGTPDGGEHWRCADCGHDWTTPPAPARGKP